MGSYSCGNYFMTKSANQLCYIKEMFKDKMLQTKKIGSNLRIKWPAQKQTLITKHAKQQDVADS